MRIIAFVGCFIWSLIFVVMVHAGTVAFSWLPNSEDYLTGYEIYCDRESLAGGGGHELWKAADMNNIVDGRVQYTWQDFPEGERYYCVCVAKGISEGQVVTSGFSDEVDFIVQAEPQIPGAPQGLQVNVIVSVSVN